MADEIDFTPQPVRVTSTTNQAIDEAIDISDYDELDLQLGILGLEGTSPTVTVRVLTSMCRSTEDGWNVLVTFTNQSSANQWEPKNATGLLRYVRWEVSTLEGTSPAATFVLKGMARRWA